ncbi:hypothetical protein LWC34_13110 [Kibdelosporangium philippinense]|uniref:Uncharacterized protein n=1 Tax=Kibdelosporangium philippinense TaxID=211113 RepID=A0ABS8Z799_9PSEU|nr:hypothetical protein [Kibdelosporangium philippinense]MCE7003758.1 hypothetical protein [Kibdelosporangium philippinense]
MIGHHVTPKVLGKELRDYAEHPDRRTCRVAHVASGNVAVQLPQRRSGLDAHFVAQQPELHVLFDSRQYISSSAAVLGGAIVRYLYCIGPV